MKLELKHNLSKTMMETLNIMERHGKLIRWKHGFWTYDGCITKYEETISKCPNFYDKANLEPHSVFAKNTELDRLAPAWYCDVKTLRALQKRGYVILDEINEICVLNLSN